jgi:hypothetical protein
LNLSSRAKRTSAESKDLRLDFSFIFYGFNSNHATPYPGIETVMRAAGVTATATGALLALLAALMLSKLAELKFPRLETSTITVRGAPLPLLSVGKATAWSSTITVTNPSAFFVASVSTVVVSVAESSRIFGPGDAGVDGYKEASA